MEFGCYNTLFAHHKLVSVSLLFYAALASTSYVVAGTSSTTIIPKRYRVATKLIHPDSIILSKYYYDNHINNTPTSSSSSSSSSDPANSWAYYYPTGDEGNVPAAVGVLPDDRRTGFLVNMSIGDPSVPQLLVMDTGSHLLWVQCRPCVHCIHQVYTPIFNPSASSTYRLFPCGDDQYDPTCSDLVPGGHCNSLSECVYFLKYMDRSNTTGILGIDNFNLVTDVEPIGTLVPDVVFGCGHNNHGISGGYTGVLGLGANDISLVTQLGSKFSYCIGSVSDPHYTYNHLIIGDGAITSEGYSTPMEIYNGHYYLTLESIIIGDKTLNIDPKIFQRSSTRGNGGVVIDSGSTYTYLTSHGYEPLRAEVERLMDGVMERLRFPGYLDYVCYKGLVGRDLKGFPAVTFQFAGEADLVLGAESMFRQVGNDSLCMAVRVSEAHGLKDLSVIGIMAQQYYNIGYDLAAMKLSFLSIDCQLLQA